MKLIDDKLKIIDDVPTSAVEMAVKEKVPILFHLLLYLLMVINPVYGILEKSCLSSARLG